MKRLAVLAIIALFSVLALAVPVFAQSGEGFELIWYTIDNGGKYSAAAPFWLCGTAGQPDANTFMSGGSYELTGGFWYIKVQYPTAVGLTSLTASMKEPLWAISLVLVLVAIGFFVWRRHRIG